MRYDSNSICKARFLSRPNRFIAEVEIDGRTERVHVKNTGRCKELLIPGCEVYLNRSDKSERKTKYDLVAAVKENGLLVNMDSQAPNQAVKEWLAEQGFAKVIPEYTYGSSRIDFYMEKEEKGELKKYLMEVKGCTLEIDGVGYFPDAPTERGIKHIRELIKAKEEGYYPILSFVIQMEGVREVRPNITTHREFGDAIKAAKIAGVEIRCFTCYVEPDSLIITSSIEI